MIILRKFLIIIFAAVAVAAVLLMGIYAFFQLQSSAEGTSSTIEYAQLKSIREAILYLSIILSITLILLFFILLSAARLSQRRAENLMQRKIWLSGQADKWYEVFGELGKNFYTMNSELITTNEARGIKIQALTRLTEFLVQNHAAPVCITNIKGEILYASPSFLEKTGTQWSQLANSYISQQFPGVKPGHIINGFQKDHSNQDISGETYNFSVYPVLDHRREITYLVFTSGSRTYNLLNQAPASAKPRNTTGIKDSRPNWLRKTVEKVLKRGSDKV